MGEKKPKEVTVIQDIGVFTHTTGDVYDGSFEARKKDKSVRMNGSGTYKSAQGDCYMGIWESDKLSLTEPVLISHPDGSKYEGFLKDWKYNGDAIYTYPDRSSLECKFTDNCPTNGLKLVDPNSHVWFGKAELGYGWFEPVNHYYELLEERGPDVVKERRRRKRGISVNDDVTR